MYVRQLSCYSQWVSSLPSKQCPLWNRYSFKFHQNQLIIFFFFHHLVFVNCFRDIWVPQGLEDRLYFVLKGLLWSFIIISMIHLKLNFYGKSLDKGLSMLFTNIQLIQHHLLKRLFLYNKLQWRSYPQTWALSRAWVLSRIQLFVTPWIATHQAPLSMVFSRQRYWTGLPFSSPEDLPDLGIEPMSLASPALAGISFIAEPPGISMSTHMWIYLRTLCCVFLICMSILTPIFL